MPSHRVIKEEKKKLRHDYNLQIATLWEEVLKGSKDLDECLK